MSIQTVSENFALLILIKNIFSFIFLSWDTSSFQQMFRMFLRKRNILLFGVFGLFLITLSYTALTQNSSSDAEDNDRALAQTSPSDTEDNNTANPPTDSCLLIGLLSGLLGGLAAGACLVVACLVGQSRRENEEERNIHRQEEEGLMPSSVAAGLRGLETRVGNQMMMMIDEMKDENSKWRKEEEERRKKAEERRTKEKEEERAFLSYEVEALDDLKTDVENQRKELRLLFEEAEKEKKEIRENLQSVDKSISESEKLNAVDKTEHHLKEKQNLLNAQWKVESRKDRLDMQQMNIDKMQQGVEDMKKKMEERGRTVGRDIEPTGTRQLV